MNARDDTITKHEQLVQHIESLKIGSKISVRRLAKEMGVSEGTAYRAVKEAESLGIVVTKERIGTVRVERKPRNISEQLTFADVVEIVEGHVLGGAQGLNKSLHKYVIGAMKVEAMIRYIDAGSLMIVGNREDAHSLALEQGAGVLITGGFGTSREVKQLADQLDLPIISSRHDTFTVASMINRAIFDRLIKKKIMLVEDIALEKPRNHQLKNSVTVKEFKRITQETGQNRYPVTDEWNRVIGIVGVRDVEGMADTQPIEKAMTRNPVTAGMKTSLASAAQIMMWEGIDFLPIVDKNRKLIATVTRKEVLGALRDARNQPQLGETFDQLIWNGIAEDRDEEGHLFFHGFITPQMATDLGTISQGVLTTVMSQAAVKAAKDISGWDYVLDHLSTYFLRPVQIEDPILIMPKLLEISRKTCKMEVEIQHQSSTIAKAVMTMQAIDHG
ncbi:MULTISPECIES: DRTGG domain-containing protein [Paenibacillus]|uniref:Transcriptional regulator n=2 Tax=Paenibacillus lactis TaxID=228574 RepID=A0ABS4F7V4_9BACL|nr:MULTISPECIES: DRTGG domain-containing protein [Paenibacillus]EHB68092.1 putative signal transduction protein with CBS and DRTGG domains [Paenibacillus lactis 154]MBP1892157.1 putative transcriptional regulator [Paenibacillus lactis]MCM3492906.1 DRTGG domain-containing protein [Paenibacillus lactis]GIO89610.1 thioesterase [Paenibacillus lactis]HAG01106.1 CBS domain-containing protein [Paenibacillus lactis]